MVNDKIRRWNGIHGHPYHIWDSRAYNKFNATAASIQKTLNPLLKTMKGKNGTETRRDHYWRSIRHLWMITGTYITSWGPLMIYTLSVLPTSNKGKERKKNFKYEKILILIEDQD